MPGLNRVRRGRSAVGNGHPRDPDLALARTHLRLGSLSLARVELETLAGLGTLDDEGIRDLAEARWRTGDLAGAGEAVGAWLEGHPDDILGLVIGAEAQAALGRPGEARRLAARALQSAAGSLDPIVAGMQRSPIWPIDSGAAAEAAGVLFDDLHPSPHVVHPRAPDTESSGPLDGAAEVGAGLHPPFDPSVPASFGGGPSLWGDDASGIDAARDDAFEPAALFHGARGALDAGRVAEAATGLILALRSSPALAPATLDLLAGRGEPILQLVRGDAQRIVGREMDAMRDHAAAATALGVDGPDSQRHRPPITRAAAGSVAAEAATGAAAETLETSIELESISPVQEDS